MANVPWQGAGMPPSLVSQGSDLVCVMQMLRAGITWLSLACKPDAAAAEAQHVVSGSWQVEQPRRRAIRACIRSLISVGFVIEYSTTWYAF